MQSYLQRIQKFSSGKIRVPDEIEVVTLSGSFIGRLMPSFDENPEFLVLKLENGYNTGIAFDRIKRIKLIARGKPKKHTQVHSKPKKSLPTILLIATGGTIASKVDYETGGVIALSKPEDFVKANPELSEIANIKLSQPFNIMSEDMSFSNYKSLARVIEKEGRNVDGIIITHGTDTLHYTAAALSFMLHDFGKPVALVGAQRSSDRGSADGVLNLLCAAHYCTSNIGEVCVVMHGSVDDDYCLAIRGTKVRKMHTERRDAFRPINDEPVAKIWSSGDIEIVKKDYKRRNESVKVDFEMSNNVALVKAYPGADSSIIDYYSKKGVKGIVLEGTGFGHVPLEWHPVIKSHPEMFFVQTSQCIYGRTSLLVYSALRELGSIGVISGSDMISETAYIKLAWVLGHTSKRKEVEKLMVSNISGEINNKSFFNTFLY